MQNQIARLSKFPPATALATLTVIFILFVSGNTAAQENVKPVDFDRDIVTIFENHCYVCHSANGEEENDPDLTNREEVMERINKGDADGSGFYQMLITDDEDYLMPPPDNDYEIDALSPAQIELIKRWIDEGAVWSGESADAAKENLPAKKRPDYSKESAWLHLWYAVGPFHLAVVHFPIALLIVSAFFAIGALRGSYVASDIAYYCLWLGAISSYVAVAFGWSYTLHQNYADSWSDWQSVLNFSIEDNRYLLHGWGGIAVSVLATVLALYAMASRRRDADESGGAGWKLGTFVVAGLVGWVGHEGGELVNPGIYDPVWEYVDRVQSKDANDKDQDKPKGEATKNDRKPDPANSEDGQPSEKDSTDQSKENNDQKSDEQ